MMQDTESIVNNIFNEENVKIEYKKTDNKRIYSSIIINKDIIQTEKSKLLSSINDKQYHIEIQNSEDNKMIIEIYNKSLLINVYELEKDNKHD